MDFLTLNTFLLLLMPLISSSLYFENNILLSNSHRKILPKRQSITSYAVIFDAGSTGSRVHIFHFDHNLDLLHFGKHLEFYDMITPGLSAYADNPKQAAESLVPLLEEAKSVVPDKLHSKTPVRLGATAGLRLLDGDASEKILQAVRDMLCNRSTLNIQPDAVAVIDGTKEGSYLWVTINYLLGNLGKKFSKTLGVVDLGGASVQMTYAVSRDTAKKAPKVKDGDDPYIKKVVLKGKKYNLYVHSYLRYGRDASRAQIFKVTDGSPNPCILAGFDGTYKYSREEYKAFAPTSGSNFEECRKIVLKVGIIDPNKPNSKIHPVDLENEAKRACETNLEDAKFTYPLLAKTRLPYVCMDLMYQYTLLVDGFGLDPLQEITVAKAIEYQDALVKTAWPIGNAIEAISSLPKFERLMYFI